MAARPFNRRQALENARFLAALARTGNARLAARELGVHRSTYAKRRARCPLFAARWDMALVAADAAMHRQAATPACPRSRSLRAEGGEPVIVRLKSGRHQLRLALPGRMTKVAEQAFLSALSASANIRLAAAAAGFAHSSFYTRRRKWRAFAREMRLALKEGYGRVERAALAASLASSHEDDSWRHNDPPPIPPMTAGQALQLLFLHEKSVRQSWDQPHRRKRRGESEEAYVERLRAMWTSEKAREAEEEAVRAAIADGVEDDWILDDAPPLPALDQVTGWSKADPDKPPHDPDRALFGGWRLKHWKKRRRSE